MRAAIEKLKMAGRRAKISRQAAARVSSPGTCLSRRWYLGLAFAGRGVLSVDPIAVPALKAASADADEGALRIECAIVDTALCHGIDLLRVRRQDGGLR